MRRIALALLAIVSLSWAAPAQDTKGAADAISRILRQQHFDGETYGDFIQTCRVLDALGRSPRRYNELDGPYFRKPAEWVASQSTAGPDEDAWQALALAGTITGRLQQARDDAVRSLRSRANCDLFLQQLALATLEPQAASRNGLGRGRLLPGEAYPTGIRRRGRGRRLWQPGDVADEYRIGLAVFFEKDPAAVSPPPTAHRDQWLAWARAVRLRGLDIVDRPHLPEVDPGASLDELIDALNLVIALHGLPDRGPPPDISGLPPPPERAAAGRPVEEALAAAWRNLSDTQDGGTWGLGLPGWDGPQAGITALDLSAAIWLAERLGHARPGWIDDGLDYLAALQNDDGSIHEGGLAVYTTSVALEALIDGTRDQDAPVIERGRRFLLLAQSDEGEGYEPLEDPHYGGIGYGGDERPDLSNTHMALEAAFRAGTPQDDPFFGKAMHFLTRNQNLAEEQVWRWPRADGGTVISGTDGGATYMPGSSPAGEDALEGDLYRARSYGSMTYALTKSYLLCGLDTDDRRVAAAIRWLAHHYTLETNPGFVDEAKAAQGLYYYYLAMSRTLVRIPERDFSDRDGRPIPWRSDVIRRLTDEQRTDGSWFNERAARWWESSPTLCTGYAVLTLRSAGA